MAKHHEISQEGGTLVITRKWWTTGGWFLVLFASFWNFVVFGALMAGAGFFLIFHLLVGLLVGWLAAATWFNTTRVEANSNQLKVTSGPVPWPFSTNRDIPARSLVQLYVEKSSVRKNKRRTYNLKAKLDSGATVKIISHHLDQDFLLDVERAIEAHLGIENDTTLGFQQDAEGVLDLEKLRQQVAMMEPIKKWLPSKMRENMENAQRRLEAHTRGKNADHGSSPPPGPATVNVPRRKGDAHGANRKKWTLPSPPHPTRSKMGASPQTRVPESTGYSGGPKPLYVPEHPFTYPLYAAAEGDTFEFNDQPYRVGRTAQIDFEDDNIPTGRQIEITPVEGGSPRYLYAQEEARRWRYYEERRLDDHEADELGFGYSVTGYPMKLSNGDDRYYPRNEQNGVRYDGLGREEARQFIYFTTSAATQFRAFQPAGRNWEVFVQEVVDAGNFEEQSV